MGDRVKDRSRAGSTSVTISDIALKTHSRVSPNENPNKIFNLYSFSAYDEGKQPKLTKGKEIGSAKYEVKSPCVLLSKLNPRINRVWRIPSPPENAVCSTEFMVLVPTDEEMLDYLFSVCKSPQFRSYLQSFTTGTSSSHQRVKLNDILSYEFDKPSNRRCMEIGSTITSFEKKISCNNSIYNKLTEVEELLFKSWFVDFIKYDEFKETELGEMPEEFEVAKVGDLCTLEYGESLTEGEREGDQYPVYGSNGITGWHNDFLIDGPGVIVGRKGVNFGSVKFEQEPFFPIDTTFYVKAEDPNEICYLYHLLNYLPFDHLGSDSAVPGLNRNVVHDQKFALPPKEDRLEFCNQITPIQKRLHNRREENDVLQELRDCVLPHLMNGDVKIDG